jgi:hypothetical protein
MITNPAAATARVTATSRADSTQSDTSPPFTLATAFPSGPGSVASTTTTGSGIRIYEHAAAANGGRVYASWPVNAEGATSVQLMVSRSDDGGKTWSAPVAAVDADLGNGSTTSNGQLECPAIAVDPANPDVLYTFSTINNANSLSAVVQDGADPAYVFSVSTDGGRTFTPTVITTAFAALSPCPDITSPAPNTVVITAAGGGCEPTLNSPPDLYVWSDSNRGAGFRTGTYDENHAWWADGETGALWRLRGDASCDTDLQVFANGSNGASGQEIESPRLFSNGKGRLCITYAATDNNGNNGSIENTFVQCSTDAGQTFTPPLELDANLTANNQPTGAFGPGGAAAIVWTDVSNPTAGQTLYVAISADNGATFGTPIAISTIDVPGTPSVVYDADGVLWVSYVVSLGGGFQAVVDKTCDNGRTFSGPVIVSDTANIDILGPVLLDTGADAPAIYGELSNSQSGAYWQAAYTLAP